MRKLFLLVLFLLIFFPLVNAAPPFQEGKFTEGLEIEAPVFDVFAHTENFQYDFKVFNISNGLVIPYPDASCFFTLYASNGSTTDLLYVVADPHDASGFEVKIDGNNFTNLDRGGFLIQCNTSALGGFDSGAFEITEHAQLFEIEDSIFFFLIFLVLLFLAGFSLYSFVKVEHVALKGLSFFAGYTFIMIINYFIWIITADDLVIASYIPIFFKWLFIIQMIAIWPMLFASFGWYFYLLYKASTLENMLKHGVPEDRAMMSEFKGGRRNG